jgi:hypothetical protein
MDLVDLAFAHGEFNFVYRHDTLIGMHRPNPMPQGGISMDLDIKDDEKMVICRALDVYLSDLRHEIGRTENYEMKNRLQREKEVINNFVDKCQ